VAAHVTRAASIDHRNLDKEFALEPSEQTGIESKPGLEDRVTDRLSRKWSPYREVQANLLMPIYAHPWRKGPLKRKFDGCDTQPDFSVPTHSKSASAAR